jgi:hypothetical protein
MKVFKSHFKFYRWPAIILVSLMASAPALAAKAPAYSNPCQTHAHAAYKKKVVEIEMASIAGDVTEMEVGNAREALQKRLGTEKENCVRMARVSASTGKSTGSL